MTRHGEYHPDQLALPLIGHAPRKLPRLDLAILWANYLCERGGHWEFVPKRPKVVATTCGKILELGPNRSRELPTFIGKRDGRRFVRYGRARAYVAKLVAAAHLTPGEPGWHVMHDDGNRLNDRIENLRYGTALDNFEDALRHGTRTRRFDEADVRDLLTTGHAGESHRAAALRYRASERAIQKIRTGKTYRWAAPDLPRRHGWLPETINAARAAAKEPPR